MENKWREQMDVPLNYNGRHNIWGNSNRKMLFKLSGHHDDVRGNHRSPVNSPHQGQWRGALLFSSICAWINNWINNRGVGDLRRHRAHHNVTVMLPDIISDNGFHWIVTETLWQLKWQAHNRNSMTMHMTSQIMLIKIRIDLNTKTYM